MDIRPIDELRATGRMTWTEDQRAWVAEPDEIVSALAHSGFNEYKREETRSRHGRQPSGGMWQGIDGAGVGFPGHLRIAVGTHEVNLRLLAALDTRS